MSITTILFDLDGTIADTNEVIQRTILETLEHETGAPWRLEALLPHWGLPLRRQLVLMHPAVNLERAVPFYRQRYEEHHAALLCEFPGVRETLSALLAAGFRLGVVTSKKRLGAHATIDALSYTHFFSAVVAEEDVQHLKPAPDPVLLALERLGVAAEETLYVGDNPDDILSAHAAGVGGIGVAWSVRARSELLAAEPVAVIDTPGALLGFVAPYDAVK